MPCRSEYMEPTKREKEARRVAELIDYVYYWMGKDPEIDIPRANQLHLDHSAKLDIWTDHLCSLCRNMTEEEKDSCIYNGRERDARRLADWWEEHESADKRRRKMAIKEMESNFDTEISSLAFYAFRYVLGRETYAPGEFCEAVKNKVYMMRTQDLKNMLKEIRKAESAESARGLGDPRIDAPVWKDFAEFLEDTIKDREELLKG